MINIELLKLYSTPTWLGMLSEKKGLNRKIENSEKIWKKKHVIWENIKCNLEKCRTDIPYKALYDVSLHLSVSAAGRCLCFFTTASSCIPHITVVPHCQKLRSCECVNLILLLRHSTVSLIALTRNPFYLWHLWPRYINQDRSFSL